DEADLGGNAPAAAVALDSDRIAEFELGQRRLVDEEAHLQIARGQQGDDRLAGGNELAPAVIDLLHAAGDRTEHLAAREPGLRRVEARLRGAQRGLRLVPCPLRPGLL